MRKNTLAVVISSILLGVGAAHAQSTTTPTTGAASGSYSNETVTPGA